MVVWHHESKRSASFQYAAIIAAIVLCSQVKLEHVSLGAVAMNAYENLANVTSMSAAVVPNPENTMLAELDQRDKDLTAREQALSSKEAGLDAKYQEAIAADRRITLYALAGTTAMLLLLIVLNFYFDIKREEERERGMRTPENKDLTTAL